MREPGSPNYPPRAPWYSRAREAGHSVLAATRLNRVHTPGRIGGLALVLGLILPGYAFLLTGRRTVGRILICAWALLLGVWLAFLGEVWTNPIIGLVIAIHATSILHLLGPWLVDARWPFRLVFGFMAVAGLITFVYLPSQFSLSRYVFLPLHVDDQVVVVKPGALPARIRRGDWVAYRIERVGSGPVQVQAGHGLGPVLAFSGETVEFLPGMVRVGTVLLPRQEGMPTNGVAEVPAACWFIWPRLRNVRTLNVGADQIQAVILDQAIVAQSQYVGRPYARWFLRPQLMTPP